MLIEVIKENEVVSCRLTTGEELVARLSKDKRDDGFVELSNFTGGSDHLEAIVDILKKANVNCVDSVVAVSHGDLQAKTKSTNTMKFKYKI